MLKFRWLFVKVQSPMMSGGLSTVPSDSVRETSWYVPSMLGVCAAAEQATSHVITTNIPRRAQHCRGKYDRFIGTSLSDYGEIAGCLLCAAVTATPSSHRASRPWW